MPKFDHDHDQDPAPPATDPLKPGDGYVQSFARGLEVLRSFGAEAPAQTLSETAERVGLTRAGARRILLTLQTLGYVEQDGRQFRLTPKVLELGFAYLSAQPWWHQAQPLMEELTQQTRESTSASVLDGDQIVYMVRVPAQKIMSINLGIGSRLPAHCTSMGRVLLASLAEDERTRRVQAMDLQPLTPKTTIDAGNSPPEPRAGRLPAGDGVDHRAVLERPDALRVPNACEPERVAATHGPGDASVQGLHGLRADGQRARRPGRRSGRVGGSGLEGAIDSKRSASPDAFSEEWARSEVQRMGGLLLQLPLQWGALLEGVNPKVDRKRHWDLNEPDCRRSTRSIAPVDAEAS